MPELPEVEVARRCLERWGEGRRIVDVAASAPRIVRPGRPAGLQALRGARFRTFDRVGKNLLITLERQRKPIGFWSHLGMTGKWLRRKQGDEAPRFSRAQLVLDDHCILHYCDLRLFGRLLVVPDADFSGLPDLSRLGPDPLRDGIDRARLQQRLARTKLPVKVALLDQSLLAGIGNIQANEALFRARIDPRRPAPSLTPLEIRALANGILASLRSTLRRFDKEAIHGDVTYVEEPGTRNPFLVYDRTAAPCPRCRTPITRVIQAGRSTFYCPSCQH